MITVERAGTEFVRAVRHGAWGKGSGGPGTARQYGLTLERTGQEVGSWRPVAEVSGEEWGNAVTALWDHRAAATWNVNRAAVQSFLAWCRDHSTEAAELPAWCGWRKPKADHTKAVEPEDLDVLWSDQVPLRERALWRCMYESASRADAFLHADVPDLSRRRRRIRVVQKGGDVVYLHLESTGFELLEEYLGDRTSGPLILTNRRPWNWRERDPGDMGPCGRRYRLTYGTAENQFKAYTKGLGFTGTDELEFEFLTLHQLRHSRLAGLAAEGWDTPRLQAVSNHANSRTLHEKYARVQPRTVERLFAER